MRLFLSFISIFCSSSILLADTPRALLCTKPAPDGKPMVYGQHNPYRMRGYILASLPLDQQHDLIFENYVLPAMDGACKSDTNGYGVLIAGKEACRKGCSETRSAFKLRADQTQQLDAMCLNHCRMGDEFVRGIVTGYELVQKHGL